MTFILAAVVTERIREAHRNTSAPIMMLFPGYYRLGFSGDKIFLLICPFYFCFLLLNKMPVFFYI
jgi:hypothetical protein